MHEPDFPESPLGSSHHDDVVFGIELSELPGLLVRSVSLSESLGELPGSTVHGLYHGGRPDPREILGKDCSISIERPAGRRHFRGIVWRANAHEDVDGVHVTLYVAPALWMLSLSRDSRIYQNKTVSEVVEDVVQRRLGSRSRRVRVELSENYEKHEYLVQYQESDYDFIARLLEREGIFFYFDHEGDSEVLVLADTVSSLSRVRAQPVPFDIDPLRVFDHEAISAVAHDEVVGATDAVIAGFDWTNPSLDVRADKTGRGSGSPALEIYDHLESSITYHQYGGRQYHANSASKQASSRAAMLDLARASWHLTTTVVTSMAGRIIEVSGCPDPEFKGRFLIVACRGSGEATEGTTGSWRCDCDVAPASMPYRPSFRTQRPTVQGLETATVVGPSGQEIYTDEHGRIKVQFHWDRQGQSDELSSCWIRVMQSWAGPGYGTFFLPRIGMEVAISFLAGDPDRPVVVGCLYNGKNGAPANPPPDQKTHSVIRTKSSLHSDGFNELRFDDTAGSERIYVHAERDFIKEVLHDRDVDVGNDERIHVHNHRTAEVDGKEKVEVHGTREKIQHDDEKERFDAKFESRYTGKRTEIYSTHNETYSDSRSVRYNGGGVTHTVDYSRGSLDTTFHDSSAECVTYVTGSGSWAVRDIAGSAVWILASAEGRAGIAVKRSVSLNIIDRSSYWVVRPNQLEAKTGNLKMAARSKAEMKCGENSISVDENGILLRCGGTLLLLSPSSLIATSASMNMLAGAAFNVVAGRVSRGAGPLWDT